MNKDFGMYLREKRLKKGFTVSQLALYSGMSTAQLSRIENGKRGVPKADNIKKIADALSVPYEEMMEAAGYLEDKELSIYLYDENQDPSEDWVLLPFLEWESTIPKGTKVVATNAKTFVLEEEMDFIKLIFYVAEFTGIKNFSMDDTKYVRTMGTFDLVKRITSSIKKINVSGQEVTLSEEELKLFKELKKHPVMFHDLASDPEKKVKELIKLYKMQQMFLEDDEEEYGEDFGDLED